MVSTILFLSCSYTSWKLQPLQSLKSMNITGYFPCSVKLSINLVWPIMFSSGISILVVEILTWDLVLSKLVIILCLNIYLFNYFDCEFCSSIDKNLLRISRLRDLPQRLGIVMSITFELSSIISLTNKLLSTKILLLVTKSAKSPPICILFIIGEIFLSGVVLKDLSIFWYKPDLKLFKEFNLKSFDVRFNLFWSNILFV